ncbi:MAG: hypothetical protein GOMPHAMPRED_007758 [Gomphillus americanus]|uniref:tripeptidyl-peptidase II n=1 Tax=Gomphillus americanus TaxID=1940652 RepID=A0A8H3ESN2_9LECA|nr:MAG: hypothetical protein GOMPHAMPRED_007758 [Gomphillus americanus]
MQLTLHVFAGLLSISPALASVLSETLKNAPLGWTHVGASTASKQISISIALKQQNEAQFYSKLHSVSDPASAEYGAWLEKEDVDAMLKPADASKTAVLSWLKGASIHQIETDDYFVHFATDVSTANKLLGANYQNYHLNGVTKIRTLGYTINHDVADHIALVHPTTFFGNTKAYRPVAHFQNVEDRELKARLTSPSIISPTCQAEITPSCLWQLYNTVGYTADPKSGSVIGFGSFLSQTARYVDVAQYLSENKLPFRNYTTISVNGAVDNQTVDDVNHGEANLDAQNIIGVTQSQLPVIQYLTAGSPPFNPNIDTQTDTNEPYLPYYSYLLKQPNSKLPQVITNSYGDEEDTVPKSYATYVCNQIAQLGSRGITILESSGDIGVGAGCRTTSGAVRFNAIFPATCPYLTAVGGTQELTPEIAWTSSSGGFSDYFARPSYQDSAIALYKTKIPAAIQQYYSAYTNFSGRGFPDVAAHSLLPFYSIVDEGSDTLTGGTSAASPVWGAIVGLLNDARLRNNKKPLGFLNPWLYSSGYKSLTDINGGAAVGCNGVNGQSDSPIGPGAGIVPGAAWNATDGWDPATGLGTPNFALLKTAVLALK